LTVALEGELKHCGNTGVYLPTREMQVAICCDLRVIPPTVIDSFEDRFHDLLSYGIPVQGQK
jgi:hypothetical protein